MTKDRSSWRRIHREGAEWEARVVPSDVDREVLEFVCVDGSRKARQVAVEPGSYQEMDDQALERAFVQARPIGGDHYGRPGKHMDDVP